MTQVEGNLYQTVEITLENHYRLNKEIRNCVGSEKLASNFLKI